MQMRIANIWPENSLLAMTRTDGRAPDALRPLTIQPGIAPHAHGSVLIGFGNTRVICSAMVEEVVPRWMKEQQVAGGWITAEYSMLPYSTLERKQRDSTRGKVDGRSTEIQRLIGRSLRAVVDLDKLGQRTMWVDCDVLQADGGTRTAAITGGCIAVGLACQKLVRERKVAVSPLKQLVAAVSVGVVAGQPVLDLNYEEDKLATVDFNLVATETNQFVEIQGSGEEATFSDEELSQMLALGKKGVAQLVQSQRKFLSDASGK